MGASSYTHFEDVEIKAVTDKAVLIDFGEEEHWVPLSQIADSDSDEYQAGDVADVSITDWFCEKEGLSQ